MIHNKELNIGKILFYNSTYFLFRKCVPSVLHPPPGGEAPVQSDSAPYPQPQEEEEEDQTQCAYA